MRSAIRAAALTVALATGRCAGTITPPKVSPEQGSAREALLVLPGLGYNGDGERAIKALSPAMRADGIDLYVPAYVARGGLDRSQDALREFIREQHLDRYARVHVFAFLAGGWTLNSIVQDAELLPNLASVVYDRSPYQERAPRIGADKFKILAWLRYGSVLFDLARTPYPPLSRPDVKIGLLVETTPTSFVRKHQKTARAYGPFAFDCTAFAQPHDDCMFVPLNHAELYTRFAEVWPEVRAFIRHHRFSGLAQRTPPREDALASPTASRGAR